MASNVSGMTGSSHWTCFLRGTVEEALGCFFLQWNNVTSDCAGEGVIFLTPLVMLFEFFGAYGLKRLSLCFFMFFVSCSCFLLSHFEALLTT